MARINSKPRFDKKTGKYIVEVVDLIDGEAVSVDGDTAIEALQSAVDFLNEDMKMAVKENNRLFKRLQYIEKLTRDFSD